jgi:Cobalamin biosynthesis protein CobT (nicotinate-mononucleotide:5, 6-dimethylbenzimidazole phosphoribosyltransferase)
MLNLVLALAMSLMTFFGGYAVWYVLRGRHRKLARRKAAEERADAADGRPAEPRREGRWGVGRDSYCYPKINDAMGYEFIKIVHVDPGLLETAEPKKEQEVKEGTTVKGNTRTTVRTISPDEDPEEAIRKMEEAAYGGGADGGNPVFRNELPNSSTFGEEEGGGNKKDETVNGGWRNRDTDDEFPGYTDEELNVIYANDPDLAGPPTDDDDEDEDEGGNNDGESSDNGNTGGGEGSGDNQEPADEPAGPDTDKEPVEKEPEKDEAFTPGWDQLLDEMKTIAASRKKAVKESMSILSMINDFQESDTGPQPEAAPEEPEEKTGTPEGVDETFNEDDLFKI